MKISWACIHHQPRHLTRSPFKKTEKKCELFFRPTHIIDFKHSVLSIFPQAPLCQEFDWQVIWSIITLNPPFCPTNKPDRKIDNVGGLEIEKWCVLMCFRGWNKYLLMFILVYFVLELVKRKRWSVQSWSRAAWTEVLQQSVMTH